MEKEITTNKIQQCCDCGVKLSFEDFRRIHPSLSEEKAKGLWEISFVKKYCPECFFNRPEKPFRKRRRYYGKY
ncbi:MAG: hypothetical protein BAJALOKI2v1_910003 [Promethearchaeota archaeon]|nr:MAG: hypothetical protein BAJALOKI2v1_910003 [Candidatus Lokiarchaeota archaeon]